MSDSKPSHTSPHLTNSTPRHGPSIDTSSYRLDHPACYPTIALVAHPSSLRKSRKRLRGYFVGGSIASQVEKLIALLIESGAIYSALWVSRLLRLVNSSAPCRLYDLTTETSLSASGASKRHYLTGYSGPQGRRCGFQAHQPFWILGVAV